MADSHDVIAERLRQFGARRAETIAAGGAGSAAELDAQRGDIRVGDRVLDLDTGIEGAVTDRIPTLAVPLGRIIVRLDRGDDVTRVASRLLKRPTPPAVSR